MSQSFLLEELRKGASSWNEWRRTHPSVRVDLSGAYLTETNLRAYDLRNVDLSNATLIGADLTRADLRGANLARADVRFAVLTGAQLAGAHFDGTHGINQKTLKASLPGIDRERKRQFVAVALVVAALAGYAYWRTLAEPAAAAAEMSPSEETGGLDGYERLTREIRRVEFPAWKIESVHVADELVTLRINRDMVDDESYLLTLASACGALLEASEASVSEIHILNRAGASGWIYDNPNNCAALLQTPIAAQKMSVAANSRPFDPVAGEEY